MDKSLVQTAGNIIQQGLKETLPQTTDLLNPEALQLRQQLYASALRCQKYLEEKLFGDETGLAPKQKIPVRTKVIMAQRMMKMMLQDIYEIERMRLQRERLQIERELAEEKIKAEKETRHVEHSHKMDVESLIRAGEAAKEQQKLLGEGL